MQSPFDQITPVSSQGGSTSKRWTLWLGPGTPETLAKEIETATPLAFSGHTFSTLTDLADLLQPDLGPGRLVLASQAVPLEDIGIIKRFLKRAPGRELVALTPPAQLPPASLLILPQTRTFPDSLGAELRAYLCSSPTGLAADECASKKEGRHHLSLSWQVLRERLAARNDLAPLLNRLEEEIAHTDDSADATGTELIDLGSLAEELLAGFSLERGRRMRFLFRPEGELSMRAPRGELELCLRNLFDLIGHCSSPDSVIRVQVSSTSGSEAAPSSSVDATIEFPDAPLSDLPIGAELEPELIAQHFGPEISASLRVLRSTAATLGASLDSLPTRPGRRRVRLRLPRIGEAVS